MIGPGRNSNVLVRWLKIETPVTSEGSSRAAAPLGAAAQALVARQLQARRDLVG
jgi:hypothetical protein